jgi:hypothetical protein
MTERGANGRACCGTQQNTRIWPSRWVISSSVRAALTDARRGLPAALGGRYPKPVEKTNF